MKMPNLDDYFSLPDRINRKDMLQLKIYKYLMMNSKKWSSTYKSIWASFYQLYLNEAIFNNYEKVMDVFKAKSSAKIKNFDEALLLFKDVLKELESITKMFQYSFASKFVHTVYPKFPIYDSRIRRAFSITQAELKESPLEIFKNLNSYYETIMSSKRKEIEKYKSMYKCPWIGDVKAIDTIIWSTRRKQKDHKQSPTVGK